MTRGKVFSIAIGLLLCTNAYADTIFVSKDENGNNKYQISGENKFITIVRNPLTEEEQYFVIGDDKNNKQYSDR